MRGITFFSILPTLLYTVEESCVNMCTSVWIQIVHVQTCSSLNEVKQHVVRGSIGLADTEGAGTPLTRGQDIPLTGARKGGRERWARQREREILRRRFSFYLSPFPHFPPWEVLKVQNREGDAKSERQRGQSCWNGNEWECVSFSLCSMLCHADVTAAAFPTGVAGCQEKEYFSGGMIPWTRSPCGCGTVISKPLPEESHGKKSSGWRA